MLVRTRDSMVDTSGNIQTLQYAVFGFFEESLGKTLGVGFL